MPLAFGPLALKPWEFERLTPAEFTALIDGYMWRRRDAEDITAWAVSIIANASGNLKRPLSPKTLLESLGRVTNAPKREKSEVETEFQELKKEF